MSEKSRQRERDRAARVKDQQPDWVKEQLEARRQSMLALRQQRNQRRSSASLPLMAATVGILGAITPSK